MTEIIDKKKNKEIGYQTLKSEIVTGHLRPGNLLMEKELMDRFFIGRTPLREILLKIQEDGLITRIPRGGTVVAPLDINGFFFLMETRMPMELFAGDLACKRITPLQLAELKSHLQRLKNLAHRNGEKSQFAELEIAFHSLVYRATQNPELTKLLEQLHYKCARVWYCLVGSSDDVSYGMEDLCELLDALTSGNVPQIKKAIRYHLHGLTNEVQKRINT